MIDQDVNRFLLLYVRYEVVLPNHRYSNGSFHLCLACLTKILCLPCLDFEPSRLIPKDMHIQQWFEQTLIQCLWWFFVLVEDHPRWLSWSPALPSSLKAVFSFVLDTCVIYCFSVSCSWSADRSTNRLCRRFSTLTDGSWRCCVSLLPSFYWCIKFENWKEKFPWWILRAPSDIHGCSDWMRLSIGARICSRVLRVISSVIEKGGWKFDVRPFGLTIWLERCVDHATRRTRLARIFREKILRPSHHNGTYFWNQAVTRTHPVTEESVARGWPSGVKKLITAIDQAWAKKNSD